MHINPFLVGNPVPPDSFVGRKDLVSDIFSKLQTNPAHNIALIGLPRFGKSSLLAYLADESVRREYLRDRFSSYRFCEVDLHDLPSDCDAEGFWQHVLTLAGDHGSSATSVRQRLEHFLLVRRTRNERVVLMIDEFEALFAYPNLITMDFLGSLRTQASKSHVLSIVLTLPWSLSECDRRIEQKFRLATGSPYLNVFLPFWIEPFSATEADALLDKYLGSHCEVLGQLERSWIYEISGGLPILVQAAASLMYDVRTRKQSYDAQQLTSMMLAKVEHHYEKMFRLLRLTNKQTLLSLCQAEAAAQDRDGPWASDLQALLQHGLIESDTQGFRVRSRGLHQWIRGQATQWLASSSAAAGVHTYSPVDNIFSPEAPLPANEPKRNVVRRLLRAAFCTVPELDAFCIDMFPDVAYLFSGAMSRLDRENILLKIAKTDEIVSNLRKYDPKAMLRLEPLLQRD